MPRSRLRVMLCAPAGSVIASAGLVLAGTFAALGTLPTVAFAEIGFAVRRRTSHTASPRLFPPLPASSRLSLRPRHPRPN
ncbi:hypothetical protein [Streptomyces sp. NPDC048527]|uniref:hypothetical protein n=1 Tax=Streptomyces sp. NPDC048527 TaxID=3365568 RepID=UPI00371D16CA